MRSPSLTHIIGRRPLVDLIVRSDGRAAPRSDLFRRLKEFVRLVAASDICCGETGLQQNAGRQVASLSHLAKRGNLSVAGQFAQPRSQVIHGDVRGSKDVAGSKFLRCANVQQKRSVGSWSCQDCLDIDLTPDRPFGSNSRKLKMHSPLATSSFSRSAICPPT